MIYFRPPGNWILPLPSCSPPSGCIGLVKSEALKGTRMVPQTNRNSILYNEDFRRRLDPFPGMVSSPLITTALSLLVAAWHGQAVLGGNREESHVACRKSHSILLDPRIIWANFTLSIFS